MSYQYEPETLIAAHQAVADLVDSGSGPGYVTVWDVNEIELATFVLDYPCGTVDQNTGRLTFDVATHELDAPNAGDHHHATLHNGDDDRLLTVQTVTGAVPVPGKLVISVDTVVAGGTVELVSFTIG